jgi:S1 RNA binding domain protein
MEFEVGSIVTGKITGITKFGAFVTLAPGKSGLVHISEIANSYVNDIREHLAEGQEVTVKVIGMDDNGRINLSIKAALPPPPRPVRAEAPRRAPGGPSPSRQPSFDRGSVIQGGNEPSFEDKLKRFMQDSDSKISGLKQFADKKGPRRRGGK